MLAIIVVVGILVSIFLIWKGSDWLTDSLVPVANRLGTGYIAVTTLLISALISVPEIFTSTYSYLQGHLDVGLGVIIGSVMINIGVTVGLSATIRPLEVEKPVVLRDGIYLIVIALVVLLMGTDLHYTRNEGIMLLLLFIPYALNVWTFEKMRNKKSKKERVKEIEKSLNLFGDLAFLNFKPSLLTFLIGAAILVAGSYLFSWSLIAFSGMVSLPEMLIGVMIGGVGTAMPNIAAAVQGTLKGYPDAAITETFGSNIFTLLITLGALILIKPFSITGKLLYFDLSWMIILHALMIAFIFKGYRYREAQITRYEGVFLMLFYLGIITANVLLF
ncbi:TPA: sodium:calcium antiporter [Candidatus Woesearchaeota archaeon]|nr:sodium:calcium antiporter [Candidatus Woesearchaeota archaeon]HII69376.1 sodium:calcium antiporter [Candidatus Woesearchaeota archaeon]